MIAETNPGRLISLSLTPVPHQASVPSMSLWAMWPLTSEWIRRPSRLEHSLLRPVKAWALKEAWHRDIRRQLLRVVAVFKDRRLTLRKVWGIQVQVSIQYRRICSTGSTSAKMSSRTNIQWDWILEILLKILMDRQLKLWLRVVNFWWRRSLRKDKKLRRLWLSHLSTVSSNREIHHR